MEELPYEKQAMAGDELPTGLTYPDQVMYLNLRNLYYCFKHGNIDKETGKREKKELLDQYRCYQYNWEMGEHWTAIIKATEAARCAYRKERTLENADALLKAVEGSLK